MSIAMVEVYRGSIVESVHYGDAVAVDKDGKIAAQWGDGCKVTYMRSAAKPLQALNVVRSGAYERFKISPREISVMCASHYGEEFHVEAVLSVLKKAGLGKEVLACGDAMSMIHEMAVEKAGAGIKPSPLFCDCSGKHAGMLAGCIASGYDVQGYLDPGHPVQKDILRCVSGMCGMDETSVTIAVDGCSAPVFAMPLKNMAMGFSRLACSDTQGHGEDADVIIHSMWEHPEMLAGTGGFCTAFNRVFAGRAVGKLGAEGVYCVGTAEGLGIAVKIADGNTRGLPAAVTGIMEQLGLADGDDLKALGAFLNTPLKNHAGLVVGAVRSVL